ncbi:MAG: putative protein YhaZ [Myxococcota bacterium]|nr:putative protein YhaZ [Myxococcota bacterium]
MAEPLKHFFNRELTERLADSLSAAWPQFPRAEFVLQAAAGLEKLELLDRARHISAAMEACLPPEFPAAAKILERSLGPVLETTGKWGMAPFLYLPHVQYAARRGLDHFEEAMALQHALTQRFSCEFSIRFFIEKYPARTFAVLERWTRDPSPHVRRLVSEGTRPRLPWAMRLRALQQNPAPVLPLLTALRDDPSEYVRRSVANHLNDIGKDHPELLFRICREWKEGAAPERMKLIRHALRSAVKRGESGALELLGGGAKPRVTVSAEISPKKPRIGERVRIDVLLASGGGRPQRLIIDLRIHFVKANGGISPKVFKLTEGELKPGARLNAGKSISLAQQTTRAHYPGKHLVEVVINGSAFPVGSFDLRPA